LRCQWKFVPIRSGGCWRFRTLCEDRSMFAMLSKAVNFFDISRDYQALSESYTSLLQNVILWKCVVVCSWTLSFGRSCLVVSLRHDRCLIVKWIRGFADDNYADTQTESEIPNQVWQVWGSRLGKYTQ
jgi:hypothetical protein